MEAPRHILRSLFRDTPFPLVEHHLSSYNQMLETSIPTFVKLSNPHQLELDDKRFVRIYIGGKEGKLRFEPPVDEHGSPIVPHACRLDNESYALSVYANIEAEFVFPDGQPETKTFENVMIGQIPLMLRSKMCYLSAMDGYSIGECRYELGGYFIIDGAERVLMTQELLGNNMIYTGKRDRTATGGEKEKSEIAEEKKRAEEEGLQPPKFRDTGKEVYIGLRAISEDATRGPYSHFMVIPPPNSYNMNDPVTLGRNGRVAVVTLPGFVLPVPVLSVFRCLGVSSDREIYDTILAGVSDRDRLAYDDMFMQLVLGHEALLKREGRTDLELLSSRTKRKYYTEVVENFTEYLFPHVEGENLFRRKAYLLGHMVRMGMDVSLDRAEPSDRDNFKFKRFTASGGLCFQEFRRIYRETAKDMLLRIDKRIQFEKKTYAGRNLSKLIERETIGSYWKSYRLMSEFSKSFKGQWGGRDGVSQILSRLSYIGYLSQLRRSALQIDPSMNSAPPRRLYASQFGLMCPIDSPDGSSVGYTKTLAVLARISTAFPSELVKKKLVESKLVRFTENILPGTWIPFWTKIFLNSELVGVCTGNTEELHSVLVRARRSGEFQSDVSLSWNRLENLYTIATDAGRPVRPIYREGATQEAVLSAKTWQDLLKLVDFVDAQESDSSRFSLVPFHSKLQSEIHMSFCMSSIANLTPFLDHNPATRNNFTIAQQKQACSWFHTNYMKRFDVISSTTVNPQKPICHTWMYREIMGAGGCMPYGENALVAFTTYGGHNQEDSMILNHGSLKRGMFQTMYFHSYDFVETMLDPSIPSHTQVANPATNPKFEEVKRKEDVSYEMLDANGVIKLNAHVDDKTVLVGMVSPYTEEGGATKYRDISELPKRGQHGRVDAIYHYTVSARAGMDAEGKPRSVNLRGIKIRIVEERYPVPGDKMASRHSQKGTCGQLVAEADMPFTASGLRPDIIFNPHGIPTRMTMGQMIEATASKIGLKLGSFVDASPFTVSNRVADLRQTMIEKGFEPYGHEVLYNGMTGEIMEADIFMGPIYYMRMKHMVEDKINYRSTGPKTLLTHQPLHGRSAGGGLAIGEMERDGMVAHGMSKFLDESFMERSDGTEVQLDSEGRLDTSKNTMRMPYAMGLFVKELEAGHIDVKLLTN